ncbi:hypothetical protein Pla110_12590 [Polystyrenella longa]|uniref:Uncharacterized protein n=1 Tax=Polystyrenella longa TaxID=2528007 RepID=A0A518CJY7_9PLAN|nr:hypothetical protein [Polystyrenella longa]QDU79548.1 hypothetical protein Pla110_12590 [Polystyrenella longa]
MIDNVARKILMERIEDVLADKVFGIKKFSDTLREIKSDDEGVQGIKKYYMTLELGKTPIAPPSWSCPKEFLDELSRVHLFLQTEQEYGKWGKRVDKFDWIMAWSFSTISGILIWIASALNKPTLQLLCLAVAFYFMIFSIPIFSFWVRNSRNEREHLREAYQLFWPFRNQQVLDTARAKFGTEFDESSS